MSGRSSKSSSSNNSNSTPTTITATTNVTPTKTEPNIQLIEKLAAQPIPIVLPPSYKPEAKYEKYLNQLVGKTIMSAALISKTPGNKLKNALMAQKGLLIKLNESKLIVDAIAKDRLHLELVSISGTKYVITTVKEKSFYGLNSNLTIGGGIVIVVLEKCVLVALFAASVLPSESIPYVENFVQNTILN
ncbi:hypothetical protein CYY_010176 [Polysphondylium violaceum]|uniref:Profilin n=1 Tax=Polysphondylium violaceum TaxID=133409 RepID=A0A8J4PJC8_9MYCE|nr:hypothetical protein CYY_010176 [Polysphondylium violaceum]